MARNEIFCQFFWGEEGCSLHRSLDSMHLFYAKMEHRFAYIYFLGALARACVCVMRNVLARRTNPFTKCKHANRTTQFNDNPKHSRYFANGMNWNEKWNGKERAKEGNSGKRDVEPILLFGKEMVRIKQNDETRRKKMELHKYQAVKRRE